MSAPLIWIIVPILVGTLSLLILRERTAAIVGGVTSLILAGIAFIVPINEALLIGPVSLKIASSVSLLGRSLVLNSSNAYLLVIIYAMCALWFFGAEAAGVARRLVPLGLIITGLLVASIAVQPFLFAALLIETAVLVAVPLIVPQNKTPGPGVVRFLIYQTLAMPFILFAGWLLAGVEASPGDLALTIQSTVMLGLGFAFLLAFFPLYNWIPQLMQESSPYVVGFLLWILPTIASIYGMGFLDRYAWLRTSSQLLSGLRLMGLLMVVTGGLWAAFQRHIGRLMAYTAIAETGFIILALTIDPKTATDVTFLLLPARGLGLAIWSLSLSILKSELNDETLQFKSVQGMAHSYPLASAGLIIATLSTAGFPLLAGFPPRIALWEGLAQQSLGIAVWFLVGLLGLLIGAVRMMAVLTMSKENAPWELRETWVQRGMLGVGLIGLFILGLFPQVVRPILEKLPLMFQHLGH
jgi:formate hydrogenlyase subunit 3/multisubunit Na+/H+ antiporter MnhD subunit